MRFRIILIPAIFVLSSFFFLAFAIYIFHIKFLILLNSYLIHVFHFEFNNLMQINRKNQIHYRCVDWSNARL